MQGEFIRVETSDEGLTQHEKVPRFSNLIQLQTGVEQRLEPGKTLQSFGQTTTTDAPAALTVPIQDPAKTRFSRWSEELDGELLLSITENDGFTTSACKMKVTLG